MRNRSKLLLSGLTAALMLAVMISTASAGRLSVSESQFRIRWDRLVFVTSVARVTCEVSLLGSFHRRSITKSAGALVGAITSADLGTDPCTNGTVTILRATLPWHVAYDSFEGPLPNMVSVELRLINASFQVSTGTACLARTDVAEPSRGSAIVDEIAPHPIVGFLIDEATRIDIDTPDFLCNLAGDASIIGRGAVETPAGRPINLTLI